MGELLASALPVPDVLPITKPSRPSSAAIPLPSSPPAAHPDKARPWDPEIGGAVTPAAGQVHRAVTEPFTGTSPPAGAAASGLSPMGPIGEPPEVALQYVLPVAAGNHSTEALQAHAPALKGVAPAAYTTLQAVRILISPAVLFLMYITCIRTYCVHCDPVQVQHWYGCQGSCECVCLMLLAYSFMHYSAAASQYLASIVSMHNMDFSSCFENTKHIRRNAECAFRCSSMQSSNNSFRAVKDKIVLQHHRWCITCLVPMICCMQAQKQLQEVKQQLSASLTLSPRALGITHTPLRPGLIAPEAATPSDQYELAKVHICLSVLMIVCP